MGDTIESLRTYDPATQRSVLDALEAGYPMLRGTIRDHVTKRRRPFLRFFACEEDLSHELPDAPLPDAVAIAGLVAFWDERVDVIFDGERRERPRSPISEALLDEFGG